MIKYALIQKLKADSGVSSLVGNRISPRRLAAQSAYPAIVIHQISNYPVVSHSGDVKAEYARIQLDIIGKKDIDVENVKSAVIACMHLFSGVVDNVEILRCYYEDSSDAPDADIDEENEFLGILELLFIWRKI